MCARTRLVGLRVQLGQIAHAFLLTQHWCVLECIEWKLAFHRRMYNNGLQCKGATCDSQHRQWPDNNNAYCTSSDEKWRQPGVLFRGPLCDIRVIEMDNAYGWRGHTLPDTEQNAFNVTNDIIFHSLIRARAHIPPAIVNYMAMPGCICVSVA